MFKKIFFKANFIPTIIAITCLLTACGGGGSSTSGNSGGNSAASGNVADLSYIAPNIIPSSNNMTTYGYVIVKNTSLTNITDITYQLTDIIGGGNSIMLDSNSAKECGSITAQQACTLKIIVAPGTIAGSFKISASNSNITKSAIVQNSSRKTKVGASTAVSIHIGIEQIIYSTIKGPDGITLYLANIVEAGTPYIMVTGVVNSNEVGDFNNIILVDDYGNTLPNQQLISDNLGSGLTSLTQGSTFAIMLPVPNGSGSNQIIHIRTAMLDSNGTSSNIQTGTDTYLISTVSDQAIVHVLPNSIALSAANPSQTITISNSGTKAAQITGFSSNSQNINIDFTPITLAPGATTTAILTLKDTAGSAYTSSATLNYNDGKSDITRLISINQNTSSASNLGKIAGLNAQLMSPNQAFITTTHGGSATEQLILTNTGNTNETNFTISNLPSGFTLQNGISDSQCIVSGNNISNILSPNSSCDITIIYAGSSSPTSGIGNININYYYNNGETLSPTPIAVEFNYSVLPSTANINFTSKSLIEFDSILNNNHAKSTQILTLSNTGEIAATDVSSVISGVDANLFTVNNNVNGINNACGNSLPAGSSCQIGLQFGPATVAKINTSASVLVNSTSNNIKTTTESLQLTGSVLTAQSANISGNITSNNFVAGLGTALNPYQIQSGNNSSLTYTITNSGSGTAQNFYLNMNNLPLDWSVGQNNCGTKSQPIALAANGASCNIVFNISPKNATPSNFNFNILKANWLDETLPNGATHTFNGITYVNVYAPATINLTTDLNDQSALIPGQSFKITANLSGGFNISEKTITIAPVSPATAAISYTNNNCQISSTNPKCVIIINIGTDATPNSYTINFSSLDGIASNPSSLSFKLNPLIIFVTHGTWDGNLGGFAEADNKCNSDIGNPSALTGIQYKALLYGNNATMNGATYYQATALPTLVKIGLGDNDGILIPSINPIAPEHIQAWVGLPGSHNCNEWSSNSSNKNGYYSYADSIPWLFGHYESCDMKLHLYCVSQP